MKNRTNLLIIIFILMIGCYKNQSTESSKVLYLQNDKLKIGILTEVGGSLVFFGPTNGINLLKADTSLWNEPDSARIIPSAFSDFKPYYGMITWLGPQSEWWKHQHINQERLKNAAVWPPDPFLTLAPYQLVSKTDSSIVICSPMSQVSGVQLVKKFTISNNKLYITITAKNTSDTIQSWDLWTNARFDSNTKYKVPCTEKGLLRISADETSAKEKMNYQIENGMFNFVPKEISAGKTQQYGKAFIYPEAGNLFAIKDKYLLKISFEKVSLEKIHPEQALVEIFHSISNAGGDDLLELEHHSEFTTLKPGESFQLKETWGLLDGSDY